MTDPSFAVGTQQLALPRCIGPPSSIVSLAHVGRDLDRSRKIAGTLGRRCRCEVSHSIPGFPRTAPVAAGGRRPMSVIGQGAPRSQGLLASPPGWGRVIGCCREQALLLL
jgi:hypothetical protein